MESMLDSWISNLSGENEYEIIVVFDGCKDKSEKNAQRYLDVIFPNYRFLYADNDFELFCNNLALEHSTGDYVLFIQDDNWMYTKDWDAILKKVINKVSGIGLIGLLAGAGFVTGRTLYGQGWRVETNTLHKGKCFDATYEVQEKYDYDVWQVDTVIRPLCISRKLLLSKGGFDKAYMPRYGDDTDLSLKLWLDKKVNIYIPFDLVNLVGYRSASGTPPVKYAPGSYQTIKERYGFMIKERLPSVMKKLFTLKNVKGRLEIA